MAGKGLILPRGGNHVVFLELRRHSRVTTGISAFPLQYIMNNAINEIKNTLEGTNSRITEAEDRISEVEDINGPRPRELRAFFSCMAWRAIPSSNSQFE